MFNAAAGTSGFLKRWQPKPGAIVSFKHNGFFSGSKKPKVPALYRIRDDVSWDEVVQNWNEPKSGLTG